MAMDGPFGAHVGTNCAGPFALGPANLCFWMYNQRRQSGLENSNLATPQKVSLNVGSVGACAVFQDARSKPPIRPARNLQEQLGRGRIHARSRERTKLTKNVCSSGPPPAQNGQGHIFLCRPLLRSVAARSVRSTIRTLRVPSGPRLSRLARRSYTTASQQRPGSRAPRGPPTPTTPCASNPHIGRPLLAHNNILRLPRPERMCAVVQRLKHRI